MSSRSTAKAPPAYLDSCVLLSLFLGDSGYEASEQWLCSQDGADLWISHWVLLEFAGVIAACRRRGQISAERAGLIEGEFECFRQERLSLLEPRGADFLQARQWLQQGPGLPLRSGDALHLALAKRHQLTLTSADHDLGKAAQALGLSVQLIG